MQRMIPELARAPEHRRGHGALAVKSPDWIWTRSPASGCEAIRSAQVSSIRSYETKMSAASFPPPLVVASPAMSHKLAIKIQ
jgi:hypothetical protein